MRLLRYFLLLASAGWIVFILWIVATATQRASKEEYLITGAFVLYAALNIIYVWLSSTVGQKPGRIGRLFSLWLDAKEAELRRRTQGDGN